MDALSGEMANKKVDTCPDAFVISGGGWPGAYDIVRALGRENISCVVASSQKNEIAFSSRYVKRKIILPPFQPSHFDEILEILIRSSLPCTGRPVLYYVGDIELEFVFHYKDRLLSAFRFLLPPDDVLTGVCNKGLFPQLAMRFGLPIPATIVFATIEDLAASVESIRFPCIVKPVLNRDWFGKNNLDRQKIGSYKKALKRFGSKDELAAFCSVMPYRSSQLVVQSYIDGNEESVVNFNGYFDEKSNCLGYFTGREIRTNPPINGESAYSELYDEDAIARLSIESLRRLRFRGIVKIDYKWDSVEKDFKMIEIEPHYQFWHLLGSYAGINLAWIAFCHQRGESHPPTGRIKTNERMLYLRQDIAAYINEYRKTERWPLVQYVASIFRKQHYRVFDPLDPYTFLKSTMGFLKRKILGE